MDEFFIFDANGIISRFFFALKDQEKSVPDAFWGLVKNIKSNKILLVFDKATNNFRKKIFKEYKKNRVPNMNLYQEINKIIESAIYENIPIEFSSTHEADDIIASYCEYYKNKYTIYIVSNDKDLMQLINEKVYIFNPFEKKIFKSSDVLMKLGVEPKDVSLFLALSGDNSDNIPGIKKIGTKTAIKMIKEKSIANLKISDICQLEIMLKLTELNKEHIINYNSI